VQSITTINPVETKKKNEKLTKLQRRWYNEYMKCFNATDALRRAYPDNKYPEESLWSIAYQTKRAVFRKLQVDDEDLYKMMGIDNASLVRKGIEGLDSTRPVIVNGEVKGVPDYATRHRYWQDFMKIFGMLTDAQRLEITGKDGGPLMGIGFLNKPKDS
jgi:hypothetical protein